MIESTVTKCSRVSNLDGVLKIRFFFSQESGAVVVTVLRYAVPLVIKRRYAAYQSIAKFGAPNPSVEKYICSHS